MRPLRMSSRAATLIRLSMVLVAAAAALQRAGAVAASAPQENKHVARLQAPITTKAISLPRFIIAESERVAVP